MKKRHCSSSSCFVFICNLNISITIHYTQDRLWLRIDCSFNISFTAFTLSRARLCITNEPILFMPPTTIRPLEFREEGSLKFTLSKTRQQAEGHTVRVPALIRNVTGICLTTPIDGEANRRPPPDVEGSGRFVSRSAEKIRARIQDSHLYRISLHHPE